MRPPLGESSPCDGAADRFILGPAYRGQQPKKGRTHDRENVRRAGDNALLGEVTDLTQMAKPGTFFDFPFSSEGNTTRFPHHMS